MEVGIRELKSKLSEYVAKAARGERVTVTDRGRAVAELAPLANQAFDRGVEDGWIEPARRNQLGTPLLLPAGRSIGDVLADDRGA